MGLRLLENPELASDTFRAAAMDYPWATLITNEH
jgi:hypothetical protein